LRHRIGERGHNARLHEATTTQGAQPDKGRWSSRRKTEVVLRIFRGETLDALSRELGVTPGALAQGRDEALAAMQAGLQSREPDHRDGFIHDLKAKVGGQATQIELLEQNIGILEDGLRRGGHRCEPGDVTLREQTLRDPARLPRMAHGTRHRP
jgi:hypothetical protein